jgi:hypothetical protein
LNVFITLFEVVSTRSNFQSVAFVTENVTVAKFENRVTDFITPLGCCCVFVLGLGLIVVGKGVYPLIKAVTGLLSMGLLGTFFSKNTPDIPGTVNDFSSTSYVIFKEHNPAEPAIVEHIEGFISTVFTSTTEPFRDNDNLSGVVCA